MFLADFHHLAGWSVEERDQRGRSYPREVGMGVEFPIGRRRERVGGQHAPAVGAGLADHLIGIFNHREWIVRLASVEHVLPPLSLVEILQSCGILGHVTQWERIGLVSTDHVFLGDRPIVGGVGP